MKLSPIVVYIILAVVVAIFYGNTLANGFVHDDLWQVVNNPQIRTVDPGKIFSGCISEELLGGCEGKGFYWRPIQAFGNALVYQVSHSATFFHLINIIYFWTAGVLVYELTRKLISVDFARGPVSRFLPASARSSQKSKRDQLNNVELRAVGNPPSTATLRISSIVPILSALTFLVHPINSEPVNWVSATPELLMTIFLLLTLIFYIKYLGSQRFHFLVLSAIFWFCALLSKETAIFLILIIISYHLIFENAKKAFWRRFYNLGIYFIPLVLYLAARSAVLGRVVYKYEGYYALSFGDQIFAALALLPRYLLKLVYPLPLSFQPQMLPATSVDAWVVFGIGLIFVMGTIGYFLYVRGERRILFGLLWVMIAILPALIFVNKLGETIFSERYLLVSTIGFAIVASELSRFLPRPKSIKVVTSGVSIVLIFSSWWVVFQRSNDWKDNPRSYEAMIRVNPNHIKAQFQLGEIYRSGGQVELSKSQYQKALSIDPSYELAKNALFSISKKYEGVELLFYYPGDWELVEQKKLLMLSDRDGEFVVEMEVGEIKTTAEEYLKLQSESLGKLVNEGPALVPNFEQGWVKVWFVSATPEVAGQSTSGVDADVTKLQFFLFMGSKVVEILVSDANSPQMRVFEGILSSMKIE